jgi:CheY-like chemotaxis protein
MNPTPSILVVDDSRVSRMMSIALIRQRYPDALIDEAPDGAAALNMMMVKSYDLAILDMNMPGMSGIEVAEAAIQDYPKIRLAILTANVQSSTRQKVEQLGIRFFAKPIGALVINQILDLLELPQ